MSLFNRDDTYLFTISSNESYLTSCYVIIQTVLFYSSDNLSLQKVQTRKVEKHRIYRCFTLSSHVV